MGIPKFFRWISERYPACSQLVTEGNVPPFDKFYLDMNGIIHHCSHGNNPNVTFRPNEEIFREVMGYLELLVSKIKPRQILYLAVDGVAPRAKMNQQRARRFRSAQEAKQQQAKNQNNNNISKGGPGFDSNCITPGTVFMQELCEYLQNALADKVASDPAWRSFKTVFSGPDVPGEGEHKIMDYIRHCKAQPDYDPNVRHCLYGLDADLILLGLLSHDPHFALLREEVKFTGNKQRTSSASSGPARFFLMHLGLLREYIGLEFTNRLCEYSLEKSEAYNPEWLAEYEEFDAEDLSIKIKDLALEKTKAGKSPFVSTERVLDDLILLMTLVGNDFLPHLPHLHINECAVAIIWAAYKRVGKHVNEFGRVNYKVLGDILTELLPFERECYDREGSLQFEVPVITNRERMMLKSLLAGLQGEERTFNWLSPPGISINERNLLAKLCEESGLEFAMANDARVRLCSSDLGVIMEAQKLIYSYITAPMDDGLDGLERWKRHYHDRKFGPTVQREETVRAFLDGIQWVMSYYYDGVDSWSWFYPYHYAPHLSDICDFLQQNEFKGTDFDIGEPFSPLNQLMAVLPPDSANLIPVPALRTLLTSPTSPLADFYPRTFRSDQNGKRASWEAVVLIPFIEAKRLVEQVRKALPADYVPPNPGCDWEYSWEKGEKQPFLLPPIPKGFLRGLCEGVKKTIAGFPKLAYLPIEPQLDKARVLIFPPLQPSTNFSLCLNLPRRPLNNGSLEELMYFEWPFVRETRIHYVDDGFIKIFANGKREPSDINLHQKALEKQQTFWQKRFGVFFEGDELVYGHMFLGMQMMPDGSIQKRWSSELSCMPLSLCVPHSSVERDERHEEKKSVISKDAFPLGAIVLSLKGKRGILKSFSFSTKEESPKVTVQWMPDPFSSISLKRTPWILASTLAHELKVSIHLLAKLSASLYVYYDSVSDEHADIGLLIKFEGREKAAEGLARKNANGLWEYSTAGAELIRRYVSHFYKVIHGLEHQVRPILPGSVLVEMELYLKEIGVGKWKMVDCKQDRLEPSAISSLVFKKVLSSQQDEELVSAVGLISSAVAGSFVNSQVPQNITLGQPVYVCDRMCFGTAGYVITRTSEYVEVKLEEPGPTGIFVSFPLTSIIPVPVLKKPPVQVSVQNMSFGGESSAPGKVLSFSTGQWAKPPPPSLKIKPRNPTNSNQKKQLANNQPVQPSTLSGRSVSMANLFATAKDYVPSSSQINQSTSNNPLRTSAASLRPIMLRKPASPADDKKQ